MDVLKRHGCHFTAVVKQININMDVLKLKNLFRIVGAPQININMDAIYRFTLSLKAIDVKPLIQGDWFGELKDKSIFNTVHIEGLSVEL